MYHPSLPTPPSPPTTSGLLAIVPPAVTTTMKWQDFGVLDHPATLHSGVALLCLVIHSSALHGGEGLPCSVIINQPSALLARVGGVGEGGRGLLVDGVATLKNKHWSLHCYHKLGY